MAQFQPVPKHVMATFLPNEAHDLILTLRSCVREMENVPESIPAMIAGLEAACDQVPDPADDEAATA